MRLSIFTSAAILYWICGFGSHVDAAPTMPLVNVPAEAEKAHGQMQADVIPQNLQVLSPKDAALYRAAFAAQEKGSWSEADTAITGITDHTLLGHLLADRYMRRPATQAELHEWMASYKDLPEAADLYSQAQKLPAAKDTKLALPSAGDTWTGSDQNGTSVGFKTQDRDNGMTFTERHAAAQKSHLAASAFYQGDVDRAFEISEDAGDHNPLALWINGLAAWKQKNIPAAREAFAKLATMPGLSSWDRAAAEFWAYRASKRTGDTASATYWLEQASLQPRSFYGLLAAHLLGHDTTKSWDMPDLTAQDVAALSKQIAGRRALALVQIGKSDLAESELRHLNPQGQHAMQEAMLALAEKSHMPSLALQLGGMATSDSGSLYDAALYPLPPWQPEHGFKIDRALIYALMRHESQFDPTAVSASGACGLMQLMPATANLMANDNVADDNECSSRLLEPAYNMALGQKYVRRLASQPFIGNNLLLLLAAYNGGPTKVMHWLDADTRNDPLLFVESLPVRETHDYVQQVMMHYWMYRARLAEPQGTLTQLAHGEWPRTSLRDETLPQHQKQAQTAVALEKLASY